MTTQPASPAAPGGRLAQDFLQDAVALLSRLAAMSSASADPEGLRRMAESLAGELRARGLAVAIREEPDEHGVLLPVVEAAGSAGGPGADLRPPILLVGHFDTVLAAATPRLEGGRLVATGAIDMKGGIVAFLKALDLIALRGGQRPALRLVLVPDEEVGGAISRRAVATAGTAARALWVLEPGEPTAAGETLVTGRRGMFHWRLEVRGRSAHSGLAFWRGRSAIVAIAEWIERAAALSHPQGGPTVNVARVVAGERSFVDSLAAGAATLLGTAHLRNVVPDYAVAEGEARFLRLEEAEFLAREMAALAGSIAARSDVVLDFRREASIAPVDAACLPRTQADLAVRLAAEAGWRLDLEEDRGGISFPNFLPDPGRIPVLDGLGPVGGGMHTREEFVEVASLERRIRLLADLLQSAATAPADPPA